MDILLHTIALEPARWTPERVSRPLADLLPAISAAGLTQLEIYEPHLTLAPDEAALVPDLARHGLVPVILSSYLDVSPLHPDVSFHEKARELQERVERFGFRKVRLFPGRSPSPPQTEETIALIAPRLRWLADTQPEIEFLLETHDGSLADEPADVVRLIKACDRSNVGLLWQATHFDADAARRQFALQRRDIRHLHLQNRTADGGFTPLFAGVIPWREILPVAQAAGVAATLEFVPGGICAPAAFDLAATLREVLRERDEALSLW